MDTVKQLLAARGDAAIERVNKRPEVLCFILTSAN